MTPMGATSKTQGTKKNEWTRDARFSVSSRRNRSIGLAHGVRGRPRERCWIAARVSSLLCPAGLSPRETLTRLPCNGRRYICACKMNIFASEISNSIRSSSITISFVRSGSISSFARRRDSLGSVEKRIEECLCGNWWRKWNERKWTCYSRESVLAGFGVFAEFWFV